MQQALKSTPSILKTIAIQAAQLKGNQNASLSFDDNRGKVIAEGVIGGALILGFAALLVANFAERMSKEDDES